VDVHTRHAIAEFIAAWRRVKYIWFEAYHTCIYDGTCDICIYIYIYPDSISISLFVYLLVYLIIYSSAYGYPFVHPLIYLFRYQVLYDLYPVYKNIHISSVDHMFRLSGSFSRGWVSRNVGIKSMGFRLLVYRNPRRFLHHVFWSLNMFVSCIYAAAIFMVIFPVFFSCLILSQLKMVSGSENLTI
jgi:hypothetical protein